MKALVCEMCGSQELVKQDGMYICQHCKTKYSLEEAKKLMIEGTVDVSGSIVIVDTSQELENLYKIARRAKDDNNVETAAKYYDMILTKDPNSWEANFYSVYYQSCNCKIAEIQSTAVKIANCEKTVLELIRDYIKEPEKQKKAVTEISARLILIATTLYDASCNFFNSLDIRIKDRYRQEWINRCRATIDILYSFGNFVVNIFGDEFADCGAVSCWMTGISRHTDLLSVLANKEINKNEILKYSEKVKKYNPSYQPPEKLVTDGGCYVATAVYGSYDCPEVWTLRRYRDNTLARTFYGRFFIHTYYAISPTLVKWFGNKEWFKKMWKPKLDNMVEKLNKSGVENTPYDDKIW